MVNRITSTTSSISANRFIGHTGSGLQPVPLALPRRLKSPSRTVFDWPSRRREQLTATEELSRSGDDMLSEDGISAKHGLPL